MDGGYPFPGATDLTGTFRAPAGVDSYQSSPVAERPFETPVNPSPSQLPDFSEKLKALFGEDYKVLRVPVWHHRDDIGFVDHMAYKITCPEKAEPPWVKTFRLLLAKGSPFLPLHTQLEHAFEEIMFTNQQHGNTSVLTIREDDADRVLRSPYWIGKVKRLATAHRNSCDTERPGRLFALRTAPNGRGPGL